jgi:hypothetical protein
MGHISRGLSGEEEREREIAGLISKKVAAKRSLKLSKK